MEGVEEREVEALAKDQEEKWRGEKKWREGEGLAVL